MLDAKGKQSRDAMPLRLTARASVEHERWPFPNSVSRLRCRRESTSEIEHFLDKSEPHLAGEFLIDRRLHWVKSGCCYPMFCNTHLGREKEV